MASTPKICLPAGADIVALAGSLSGYGVSVPVRNGSPEGAALYPLVDVYRTQDSELAPLLPVVAVPDLSPSAVAGAMRRVVLFRDGSTRSPEYLKGNRYAGLPIVALDAVLGKVVAGETVKRGSVSLLEPHKHLHSPESPSLRSVTDPHTKKRIGRVPAGALEERYRELYHSQTAEETEKARRKLGRMRRAAKSCGVMAFRSG